MAQSVLYVVFLRKVIMMTRRGIIFIRKTFVPQSGSPAVEEQHEEKLALADLEKLIELDEGFCAPADHDRKNGSLCEENSSSTIIRRNSPVFSHLSSKEIRSTCPMMMTVVPFFLRPSCCPSELRCFWCIRYPDHGRGR